MTAREGTTQEGQKEEKEIKIRPPSLDDYLLDKDTASILSRLYPVKQRLYRPAAIDVGVHHEILRRKLSQLKRKGYAVRPLFNYKMLGLEMLNVIFAGDRTKDFMGKPFVRSISRIYPTGDTLVVFFVPKENVNEFRDFLETLRGVKIVEQTIFRERSAPDFEWFGLKLNMLCKKEALRKLENSVERYHSRYNQPKQYPVLRFAAIDLAIMATLETEQIPPPPSVIAKKNWLQGQVREVSL